MKRRTFITLAAAAVTLPTFAMAEPVDYTPGLIQKALADGKTVFVDYTASWCSTCKRQERVINELRAENDAYDASMVFVNVDWDDYKSHEVTKSRGIPRRSTLIVLKGDAELGRIVAGTSKSAIKELMDTGL